MKPNILYFVADQMRADSQHYLGNPASITPNLDRLVKEGVGFENAYCQNPVCVPSRCSFLSGLYPHTTGHRTMHYVQNDWEPNILRIMKNAGYEVIWLGRNDVVDGRKPKTDYCSAYFDGVHEEDMKDVPLGMKDIMMELVRKTGKKPEKRPFSKNVHAFYVGKSSTEDSGPMDVGCVKSCLAYLDRRKKEGNEKPFFIYCTLSYPHPPYECADPWYSSIDRTKLPPRKKWNPDKPKMLVKTANNMDLHDWSEEKWNELRATYLAMVSKWDSQLGEVVDKLKEIGEYDNTSIFCFADHGDYTGDYDIVEKLQNCFENDLTNVPLVIKPAKQFACKPRVTKALAELVDLNATVSEMTGVELGYVQYGESLVHVLAGDEEHKKAVFSEGGRPNYDTPAKELGHDDPHDPYWPRLNVQHQDDGSHGRAVMMRMGNLKYTMREYERDELYDLDRDPDEQINEIDNPEYKEKLMEMKDYMLRWYQATADYVPDRKDVR